MNETNNYAAQQTNHFKKWQPSCMLSFQVASLSFEVFVKHYLSLGRHCVLAFNLPALMRVNYLKKAYVWILYIKLLSKKKLSITALKNRIFNIQQLMYKDGVSYVSHSSIFFWFSHITSILPYFSEGIHHNLKADDTSSPCIPTKRKNLKPQ